jgi:hypothetical protein
MANKILLISEETLKKQSILGSNLDGVYLYPSICLAQDLDLTNILGPVLVKKLCDLVESGNVPENYKFLLDTYVTNYLVWAVSCNLVPIINYKLQNAGVSVNNDTQRSTLDFSSSKTLQRQLQNYADAYATKMKHYLVHNTDKFPEYSQYIYCEGAEEPQRCGIVFDSGNVYDYRYK